MGPEDVARVMGDVAHKLGMSQGTQSAAVHAEVVDVDPHQAELLDRPLDPVSDMHLRPQHWVWKHRQIVLRFGSCLQTAMHISRMLTLCRA